MAKRLFETFLETIRFFCLVVVFLLFQPYHELLPYTGKGPTETPPIPNYVTPDGNYTDKSKKWIITATGELI